MAFMKRLLMILGAVLLIQYFSELPALAHVVEGEHGPRLRDILGGIGWIFGIVGIVAYWRSKKRNNNDS